MTAKDSTNNKQRTPGFGYRLAIAIVLGLSAVAYTVAVVSGLIAEHHRIDAVNLAAIAIVIAVVAVLLDPELLKKLKRFKAGGFEVEMQQLKEHLNGIDDILPLLFLRPERKILLKLADGTPNTRPGTLQLRRQLLRLRQSNLIRMRRENPSDKHSPLKHLHWMTNGSYNVEDWVELTTFGKSWIEKIREIDREAEAVDGSNAAAH